MSYIADTWFIKEKQRTKVEIAYLLNTGYYIHALLWEVGYEYLHYDGTWHPTMDDDNGNYHYHASRQSAIDLCKHYDLEVV